MTAPSPRKQLDRAILGLRSMVFSGRLPGGSRISEVETARHLGLSRTPLRQAMDRLVAEGLLTRIDTGGCRVASFSAQDIDDAIELRGVVEGTAARLAAERGVPETLLARGRAILSRIDAALAEPENVNFDAYIALNAEFHSLLAGMSGSPLIEREVRRVCGLPLASPSAFLSEQELVPDFLISLRHAQRHHHDILDAIAGREGARAEALAREHARLAKANFAWLTREQPVEAARIPGFALVEMQVKTRRGNKEWQA